MIVELLGWSGVSLVLIAAYFKGIKKDSRGSFVYGVGFLILLLYSLFHTLWPLVAFFAITVIPYLLSETK